MSAAAPYPALRATPAPALPVAAMMLGKSAQEAADLLPRLFNLCREAQGVAARAAFGLPLDPGWRTALRHEILREHVVKLCLKWPILLSRPALRLPPDWSTGTPATRAALFGPAGRLPDRPEAFGAFLRTEAGIAPVLRAIGRRFAAQEACRSALAAATPSGFFRRGLRENSVASRQAAHPVLRETERDRGRGPLWSAVAVAYDLQAMLDGDLPPADLTRGRAVVPAARGLYGVRARVENGRITAFERVTPTDHLLAPGGALDQSLAGLPARRAGARAPLLLSILDPCCPIALDAVHQGEHADA